MTDSSIKRKVALELHRSARKNFVRRRVEIKSLDDLMAADLVEMRPYSRVNKNYNYILTVINCFSKYVWAIPLKSKTEKEVAKAFESILSKITPPRNLHTDKGKEFYNRECKELFEKYGINHYSTHSVIKSPIIERFNRTLKNMMYIEFSIQGSYKYLEILPQLLDRYNHSFHRTIQCAPVEVTEENEDLILEHINQNTDRETQKLIRKFKENDKVRISKHKALFDKGYTSSWSGEIFNIVKVQNTKPVTYLLKDEQDQDISGGFYTEELAKTNYPNVYLIEKVLKRRGKQLFVKWLGYNSSHNLWISENDIVK